MRVASAVDLTSEQGVAAEAAAAEDAAAAGAAAETDRGHTSVPALFDTYSECADALRTGQVDAVATCNSILSGIAAKSGGAFKGPRHPVLHPVLSIKEFIQPVRRGGFPGCVACGGHVKLRGHHRLVTQQIHQRVDVDVGVGQFGGKGVPKAVHEGAAGSLAVDAGPPEGSLSTPFQAEVAT
jgi:hypothetical protein